ncbi:MAG: type II toxin-antitoxin system HipA family toxin [Burkholderiales bacterium]
MPGEATAVPAGLLTLLEEGAAPKGASFVYGLRYLDRPNVIEIDPVSLGLRDKDAVRGVELHPVPGLTLFGAMRDAAPDAWGRRVIEARRKAPLNSLPESEYLLAAGANRVGALDVRTGLEVGETLGALGDIRKLDYFLEAAHRIEEGSPVPARLEAFFDAGSALGGARPKATVADGEGKLWLAKFPSRTDSYDLPLVEAATLKLAGAAGLTVPRVEMVELGAGQHVMLIERFDRTGVADAMTRRHFISALTLVGCTEQDSPQKNYADIADALRRHGVAHRLSADLEELFARMVFNILVSNDDDHLRNHGLLWEPEARGWVLSPLYDVVPRPVYASERFMHLGVGPQGRLATLTNAMGGAARFGLTHDKALAAVDKVWRVVREWKGRFEEYGVPGAEIDKVSAAFRHAREIGGLNG